MTLFQRQKSPAELHCEAVIDQIQRQPNCDAKWSLFQIEKKSCFTIPLEAGDAIGAVSNQFKELYFEIGRCFSVTSQLDKVKEVFDAGLRETDWELEGSVTGLSAHQLMKRELELSLPPQDTRCWDLAGIEKEMEIFAKTLNLSILKGLIYSENSLEFAQPSSDVGGPLSFTELTEGLGKFSSSSKLTLRKKVGQACFLIEGWGDEFPWRAFCFEPIGDKKCFYLRTLWAGFKGEEADFERQILERASEVSSGDEP